MSGSEALYSPALVDLPNQGVPLLDGVDVVHGPRKPLGRFFLIVDAALRNIGLYARVHTDLATLEAANVQLRDTWGPLGPMFSPSASRLTPETSFWLSCHNKDGRLAAVYAARSIEVGPLGLADEFRCLRIYYSDPEPHLSNGTRCIIEEEAAEVLPRISGRVAYVGGNWINPEFRGAGLPYLMARVGRNLALTRWNVDHIVSLARGDLIGKGLLRKYGYINICKGLRFEKSYRGDFSVNFLWMDRDWCQTEMVDYLNQVDEKMMRGEAILETTISPLDRHGSSNRS